MTFCAVCRTMHTMVRTKKIEEASSQAPSYRKHLVVLCVLAVLGVYFIGFSNIGALEYNADGPIPALKKEKRAELDKDDYNSRMLAMSQLFPPVLAAGATTTPETAFTKATATDSMSVSTPLAKWPTAAAYPLPGAILPFNRIIAYYGNFYSTKMGALGEYPEEQMLSMLKGEVAKWTAADPEMPAIPAIHYIAATAQGSAGEDGMYRFRMPDDQIDHAVSLAKKIDGIVFLDLQIGMSTIQREVPVLEKYLSMPQVHLGIDPEFAMWGGHKPGDVVGTLDAAHINWIIEYLSKLVQDNNLPPKVLVIHRFTQKMLTNAELIRPTPEVQVVIHMDGWGAPDKKFGTYRNIVAPEPVQFTGFKIFYRNDMKPPSTRIMTPADLLPLVPAPVYIQYQ